MAQTAWWFLGRFSFARTCARRYGPCFRIRLLGFGSVVVVTAPDQMRDVLGKPDLLLAAGEANSFGGLVEELAGADSILLQDGEAHGHCRTALARALESAGATAETETRAATRRQIRDWPRGRPFELVPAAERISLEVLASTVLGVSPERRGEACAVLGEWASSWDDPQVLLPWLRSRRGRLGRWRRFTAARAAVRRLIASRLDSGQAGASVTARLQADRSLPTHEAVDQVLSLFAVGHQPTANAIAWALELLAWHPEAQARLRASLAAGEDEYLQAVIQETLRLRPVGQWMARRVKAPVAVCGGQLREGELVVPNTFLAHHSPASFPDAETFRPERFLEGSGAEAGWLPFGAGPRRCLGEELAVGQLRGVLREVVEALEISPGRARPEQVVPAGISLVPKRGAPALVKDLPGAR